MPTEPSTRILIKYVRPDPDGEYLPAIGLRQQVPLAAIDISTVIECWSETKFAERPVTGKEDASHSLRTVTGTSAASRSAPTSPIVPSGTIPGYEPTSS